MTSNGVRGGLAEEFSMLSHGSGARARSTHAFLLAAKVFQVDQCVPNALCIPGSSSSHEAVSRQGAQFEDAHPVTGPRCAASALCIRSVEHAGPEHDPGGSQPGVDAAHAKTVGGLCVSEQQSVDAAMEASY